VSEEKKHQQGESDPNVNMKRSNRGAERRGGGLGPVGGGGGGGGKVGGGVGNPRRVRKKKLERAAVLNHLRLTRRPQKILIATRAPQETV